MAAHPPGGSRCAILSGQGGDVLPADVTDRAAVANDDSGPAEVGAVSIEIEVAGQVTSLGPDHAVGAITPLADGGSR